MSKIKEKLTERYTYTKGEKLHLDGIYNIQGLGGGKWWENQSVKDKYTGKYDENSTELNDDIVITEDIEIEIIITRNI